MNMTSIGYYGSLNSSWTPWDYVVSLADSAGNDYSYWGHSFTFARKLIVTEVASEKGNVPETYSLSQNYPNPFNPSTTIRYGLPIRSEVVLTVFNTLGQQVAHLVQEEQGAGHYEVRFDGTGISGGMYFYRIRAGEFVETRRMLVLR